MGSENKSRSKLGARIQKRRTYSPCNKVPNDGQSCDEGLDAQAHEKHPASAVPIPPEHEQFTIKSVENSSTKLQAYE